MKYDIAAYIWPAYTGDEPRTRMFWREGIGEWQSVKNAKENSVAKPDWYNTWKDRQPIWGYQNEADPEVMVIALSLILFLMSFEIISRRCFLFTFSTCSFNFFL